MRLRERIAQALLEITDEKLVPEFSRQGNSDYSCVLAGRKTGPDEAAQKWNVLCSGFARAEARGIYLNLYVSDDCLLEEMIALAETRTNREPKWNSPHAACIHRLRADRMFGRAGLFSHETAMAVLKLEQGLTKNIPTGLLHPTVSCALEAVCQKLDSEEG